MAVPMPVNLVMGSIPQGFKGNLQEYANVIIDNTTATVDATFLVGQMGGSMPTSDIGPWQTGDEWWFWDSSKSRYMPSNQGVPIGTIVMWGGAYLPSNNNWLLCDGRQISRSVYSLLFDAIGTTWGPGDGSSSFNLPPGGKFFINTPGFVASPEVPLDSGYAATSGVNARGGSQLCFLETTDMPPMKVPIKAIGGVFGGSAGTWALFPEWVTDPAGPTTWTGAVCQGAADDKPGTPTGQNQTNLSVMPPFVAVNHIIKFT